MAAAMRPMLALVAAAVVVAVPAAGSGGTASSALVVGDSLAAGTRSYLPGYLPGWRLQFSARVGAHTAQGVRFVQALGPSLPPYLVVSLGTNDDPRAVAGFRAAVRTVLAAAGARRCVVWLNIARPAARGATYAGYNRALALEAGAHANLRVVDWQRMVRRNPVWLRRDRVHVSADGYRARAAAIADALGDCPR